MHQDNISFFTVCMDNYLAYHSAHLKVLGGSHNALHDTARNSCEGDYCAQLVEHLAVTREVVGSNPGRINTQDLKITEEKVLPL